MKANAELYLREHPDVQGQPVSLPEAIELRRIVFGHVLKEV